MLTDELLSRIPSDLRCKAALVSVYGPDANQMLLVTRDDDVYSLTGFADPPSPHQSSSNGNNGSGHYFYPSAASPGCCQSHRIDVLCGKGICEIAHSGRYVLLRTRGGEMISFGDGASCNNNNNNNSLGYSSSISHQLMMLDERSPMTSSSSHIGATSSGRRRNSAGLLSVQSCTLVSAHPLLQDKKIVQICCGTNHASCLTSYGEVFTWGIVKDGGYERGRCNLPATTSILRTTSPPTTTNQQQQVASSPTVTFNLPNEPASPLSPQQQHDFFIPNSGSNGGGGSIAGSIPASTSRLALSGCIARKRSPFVEIASYQDFIVALDEDGRLYEWQFDVHHRNADQVVELSSDEGLLNCRMLTNDASIRDVHIVHIASGRSHCLAVSNSFAVYAWGCNDSGQLGLGSSGHLSPCQGGGPAAGAFVVTPTRVPFFDEAPSTAMKKIKAVASHNQLDISVAEAVTGDIYVWGDLAVCGFSACTARPTWTRCRSISDAVATYGRLGFTHNFVSVPYPTLAGCLREAFDSPEHSDVQIVVPGSQPIYAHRAFLQIRSPRFLAAFGSKVGWHQQQNGRTVLIPIQDQGMPYNVIRAFLLFLYTNEFRTNDSQQADFDCDDFISLAELAESCGEISLRKQVCDHLVANGLTVENVAFIFSAVLKRPHLEKENSLPSACLSFILANLVDVVRSESFASLDGSVAKRILVEAASSHKATAKKP